MLPNFDPANFFTKDEWWDIASKVLDFGSLILHGTSL